MGDERGRNSSKLYSLIKSLSKKEKHQFWSFISSPSKRTEDGKYLQLFEFFAKAKSLQVDPAISKIFAGDQKAFNDCSRYLSIKILECLALNDYGVHTEKVMIDKAIEKGFVKLAGNLLRKEVAKATEKEDVAYLKDLMERHRKLVRYFGEAPALPKSAPSKDRILLENAALARADFLYNSFVQLLPLEPTDRENAHNRYKEEVQSLIQTDFFQSSIVKLLKLKTLWFMLVRDVSQASQVHQHMLRIVLQQTNRFPIETIVDELSMGVSFMIHAEMYKEAESLLYELGSIESSNEAANRMALKSWILNGILIAACTGNPEIGKMALREFQKQEKSFPSPRRAFLYSLSSVVSIYQNDWDGVLEFQRKLSRISEGVPATIQHIAPFIKGIAFYEMGQHSEVKLLAKSLREKTNHLDLVYPTILIEILDLASKGELEGTQSQLILHRMLNQVTEMEGKQDEEAYIQMFNIESWLKSRIAQIPIQQYILDEAHPTLVRIKMTS